MGRAPCCAKVGLKKGRWTAEEDQILINYITANGEGSWRSLPKNAGLLRCGKSCRLRWINYLRADLKRGNISKEEEELIVKLHTSLGNRWSLIASHLPGRTDNEIKNYWNSHLSRKIDSFSTNGSGGGSDGEAVTAGHSGKQRGGRSTGKKKYSTKEKRKDVSSLNSAAQSDETQASSVTVTSEGPNCEMLSGLLSPSIMDSGLLEMSNDMEELDAIFLDPSDSSGSGVAMSTSEEREGGSMVLNSEGESGPVGLKEGRRGDGTLVGQSEIMDQMEEVVEVGQPFDWDFERLETELLNEAGETWAWHEEEGYQQDSFASWLLSDAI